MSFFVILTILGLIGLGQAQFFDPVLDDKTYLDKVEEQIQAEVEDSALELLEQSKIAEKSTKAFIELKLRENVFLALRTIAEAELAKSGSSVTLGTVVQHRVGRKDDEDSDTVEHENEADEDATTKPSTSKADSREKDKEKDKDKDKGQAEQEQEEEPIPTTELNGLATAVKINQNVFNFLGEAVKTVFQGLGGSTGGKTSTFPRNDYETGPGTEELVEAIPVLQRRPYGEQLVGLLSLFSSHRPQLQNQIVPLNQGIGTRVNAKLSHFLYGNKNKNQVVVDKTKQQQKKAVDTINADPKIIRYIDNLRNTHPYLLPDLYKGIGGANRFLESMNKVVDGINKEIIP